jgi:hypothetical protein
MNVIARKHWNALNSAADSGDTDAQWELGYYCEYWSKMAISIGGAQRTPAGIMDEILRIAVLQQN